MATDRCEIQIQDVTGVEKIKYQMGRILWAQCKSVGQNANAASGSLSSHQHLPAVRFVSLGC